MSPARPQIADRRDWGDVMSSFLLAFVGSDEVDVDDGGRSSVDGELIKVNA